MIALPLLLSLSSSAPAPAPPPGSPARPSASAEPAAPAKPADEEVDSPLVPPKEAERMRERPIGAATWKPMTGVRLKTTDGRFALTLRLRAQLRYELEHDDEANETENVFTVRRARIQMRGHVFGEHNKYYFQIALSPKDMDWTSDGPTFTPIRDWQISFDYLRDLTVTIGQMKKPFNRQRVMTDGNQQLVDRSITSEEFNIDRDVGVKLSSQDIGGLGYLRYSLGVFNGEGRDGYRLANLGFAYVGRLEVLPMGNAAEKWDYDEVDWKRSLRPSVSLGMSYAYDDRAQHTRGSHGSRFVDGGSVDYHHAEADALLNVAGLSVMSEFEFRQGHRNFGDATIVDDDGAEIPAPRIPSRDGLAYHVQAGFLIPRLPLQIAARWGQIFGLGGPRRTSLPDRDELGAGLSWYIARHSLKIQADYFRERSDLYDPTTVSFQRRGWRDGTDQVRVQVQLAF